MNPVLQRLGLIGYAGILLAGAAYLVSISLRHRGIEGFAIGCAAGVLLVQGLFAIGGWWAFEQRRGVLRQKARRS